MKSPLPRLSLVTALAMLTACAGSPGSLVRSAPDSAAAPRSQVGTTAADAFLDALRPYCGKAFAGRIVADLPPPSGPDAFAGRSLVMHFRECRADVLRIPFHVGDDHSRTWVLSRTAAGLQLKHDHRHADGAPDATTMYGGTTALSGTPLRQEFPVDVESIAMFQVAGPSPSATNTWAMEVRPGSTFVYELARPGGRLFRVEFDLGRPVANPPPPWGSD